jgi:hypothetical protein
MGQHWEILDHYLCNRRHGDNVSSLLTTVGFSHRQLRASPEQHLFPTFSGHRGSRNNRLHPNGTPGFGMLLDEHNQYVEPPIIVRAAAKGFNLHDINLSSLDAKELTPPSFLTSADAWTLTLLHGLCQRLNTLLRGADHHDQLTLPRRTLHPETNSG